MIINEQGFTERLSSQANRISPASSAPQGTTASSRPQNDPSADSLQLSGIAARLQSADSGESPASRASRVSQLAQLVGSGAYRIDPARISSALISEAVQSSGK